MRTEGAESASLQEDSSRTEVSVEKSESSREEHPNVTVIVDGPDDGAKSAVSDSQPQPVINHSLPENGEKKPCDAPANQVESNTDQDLSNVSEHHTIS